MTAEIKQKERIAKIVLDEASITSRTLEHEHDRAVAINDLLEENHFAPKGLEKGPYHVNVSTADNRLTFKISEYKALQEPGPELMRFLLPIAPFRSIIRDYFMICESYFEAVKNGQMSRIEAIDMGRRGIHNEGSEQLAALLADKIAVDFDTARRLFTLICVLHIK